MTIFDFDGTLITADSFPLFLRHAVGRWRTFLAFLRAAPEIIAWKRGKGTSSAAKERVFSNAFKGMPATKFADAGAKFSDEIDKIVRPEMMRELAEAHERGDRTVIVSASIGEWIRPWASRHGFDRVIATEAEVGKDGILTGRFSTPNCHYEEKVTRLVKAFPEFASRFSGESSTANHETIRAFGDSRGDDALLAFADEGVKIKK